VFPDHDLVAVVLERLADGLTGVVGREAAIRGDRDDAGTERPVAGFGGVRVRLVHTASSKAGG